MSWLRDWLLGNRNEIYQVQVGEHRFAFELIRQKNGVVRLYVDDQPSYGSRSADLQSTHRYYDGRRYFVCINDRLEPRNNAEAREWADYFAVSTTRYIQTGQAFS